MLRTNTLCHAAANIQGLQTVQWLQANGYGSEPICIQPALATTVYFPINGREAFRSTRKTEEVKISPNPTAGIISISGIIDTEFSKAIILDLKGTEVAGFNLDTKINQSEINISNLASGIYNLILQN